MSKLGELRGTPATVWKVFVLASVVQERAG